MEAPKDVDFKRKQISSTCEKRFKMSMVNKSESNQKKNRLILERKIELLNDWRKRKDYFTHSKLALKYNIGESTVFDIIHSEEKLRQEYAQRKTYRKELTTKSFKRSDWPELDEVLAIWFIQEREKGTPISGSMIATKALIFHLKIKERLISEWKLSL